MPQINVSQSTFMRFRSQVTTLATEEEVLCKLLDLAGVPPWTGGTETGGQRVSSSRPSPDFEFVHELIGRFGLVQAGDPDRPAYHVRNPKGRRRSVLSDIRQGGIIGYLIRTSLPDQGRSLIAAGVTPKGSNGVGFRIDQLTREQLEESIAACVRHLED